MISSDDYIGMDSQPKALAAGKDGLVVVACIKEVCVDFFTYFETSPLEERFDERTFIAIVSVCCHQKVFFLQICFMNISKLY